MEIDRICFKLDKPNAKALIEGFLKDGKVIRQAIYCLVREKKLPMLITLNRTKTKFPLSRIGEKLNDDITPIKYKYVANIVQEYFIENKIELWTEICNNDLFDIWEPIAPYNRFKQAKTDPSKFRIGLIRIYEIEEEFLKSDISFVSDISDSIKDMSKQHVTIKKPLIDDITFNKIKESLEETLKKFGAQDRNQQSIKVNSPI